MHVLTPIQKHYENSNVFITGVTGFIGKYLLEKILRSCSQVNKIYVLLRPKKNKSIEERLEIVLQDPVFEKVLGQVPNLREKIVLVPGDLSLKNLGISVENQQVLIDSIDLVFHSAATVRFNDSLPSAVQTNVIATRDLLLMARQMKNLKSFVYISTAYSNCNQKVIREKVYDLKVSCDSLINLVGSIDEKMVEKITPILLQNWPNTYAFTKATAEDCVRKYGEGLPVCIVRPSIVATTSSEPIVGWTDNINGITGHCFAFLTGYLRVTLTNIKIKFDVVPADLTGNLILAAAWDQTNRETKEVKVYNFVSGERNPVLCKNLYDCAISSGRKCPTTKAGGYYYQVITGNIYMYKLITFFLHIVPAAFIDVGLKLKGEKPRAIKLYDRVHKFMIAISHFTLREWTFEEDNTLTLLDDMDVRDRKLFPADIKAIVWEDYLWDLCLGVRKYLHKEDPSTIPEGIKRQEKLKIVHYTIVYIFYAVCLYVIYNLFKLFL